MEGQLLIATVVLSVSTFMFFVLILKYKSKVKDLALQHSDSLDRESALEKKYFALLDRADSLDSKYSNIVDIEAYVSKATKQKNDVLLDIEELRNNFKEKREVFERLVKESAIYDENIKLAELGFYKPHFEFDSSAKFKEEISAVKQKQKDMLSDNEAIFCTAEWTLEGSRAKGKTMTNRAIRLTARAFNNECDAAVSNARWNNIDRMEARIQKAYEAINKLNQSNKIIISHGYYQLKLNELRLTHEYAEKKQKEKEEQQEIKRQMREEVKLAQEMEKALKEEDKYNKMLEKARKEAEKASGAKLQSLKERIAELDGELALAHEKSERAKSMAEQTKRGHVYVISNVGSFGENVYKVGMTRRLEPMDRVKELGDASVPFTFDVHAMIHCEDAPALENSIHKRFDELRLNLVNRRKEFFRVSLEDIKNEVFKISPEAEFIETAEARDYRESQAILAQREHADLKESALDRIPETI